MGNDVDILLFDWNDTIDAFMGAGCYDRHVVESVCHMYGEKVCDKYVLLLNEYAYDNDPMLSLCVALDSLFDIEDSCDALFGVKYTYIDGYPGSYLDEEKELAVLTEYLVKGSSTVD